MLLLSGSGPNDKDETIGPNHLLRDLADTLSLMGYASLRYDKRTRVYGNRTTSLTSVFTYQEEVVDDALYALEWIHSRPDCAGLPVYVLGHSLSAMLLPLIAQQTTCPLAGYIALAAPSMSLQKSLRRQLRHLMKTGQLTKEQATATEQQALKAAPPEYWKFDRSYKPVKAHKKLALPMLYLQGTADYQVTPADLKAYEKQGNTKATYVLLPSVNHLMGTNQTTPLAQPSDYGRRQPLAPVVADELRKFLLHSH